MAGWLIDTWIYIFDCYEINLLVTFDIACLSDDWIIYFYNYCLILFLCVVEWLLKK